MRFQIQFGKDMTSVIKGFAILFMIILHCANPKWYDFALDASCIETIIKYHDVFKLCVGIFAFMVGYGYAFSKTKDWRYSLQHIKKLLIPFWVILLIFTLPIAMLHNQTGGLKIVLLNLFGINSELNFLSWFVAFYIYAMIVMPFIARLIDKKPILYTILLIVVSYGLEMVVHTFYTYNDFTQRLFDCLITPIMLLGYIYAHLRLFTKIKLPQHWTMTLFAVAIIVVVFVMRYHYRSIFGFNLDFFYAPIFIFAVLILFNLYKITAFKRVMMLLGDTSVYMWFFHALFFTGAVRWFYQPSIHVSGNLIIITLWTTLITFIASYILIKIQTLITNYISN
mgnify:CR=1 FL=1